jgi:hypothetical protein
MYEILNEPVPLWLTLFGMFTVFATTLLLQWAERMRKRQR